jgi:DNA modification methylase
MLAYLTIIAPRLRELYRVLRPTGSLYLHCDPSASHYLRVLLDAIFGPAQFRNEIVWRRTGAHAPRRSFGPIHDTLLFYSKSEDYFFHVVRRPYMRGHVERRYKMHSSGRLKFTSGGNVLTGANATGGASSKPWRGFDPASKNRHWAIPGFLAERMPAGFVNLSVHAKLEALYGAGLIEIHPDAAWPVPVRYLDKGDGQAFQDIWSYQPYTEGTVHQQKDGIDADVAWLGPTDPERLGYQTQKPTGLLERIISSSCPEDGLVLDPFCGSGTTLLAAEKLTRHWIGIDNAAVAIRLAKRRLGAVGLRSGRDYRSVTAL